MSAELHLARRYLLGLRRRTHVATVTLISMVGLGLGVLALVVTLALLDGFQWTIRSEIVNRAAHARVVPLDGRQLENPTELASVLRITLARCTSTVSSGWPRTTATILSPGRHPK